MADQTPQQYKDADQPQKKEDPSQLSQGQKYTWYQDPQSGKTYRLGWVKTKNGMEACVPIYEEAKELPSQKDSSE